MKFFKHITAFITVTAVVSGCSTISGKNFNETLDTSYQMGMYRDAANQVEDKLKLYDEKTDTFITVEPKKRKVLEHLAAAENWRMAGDSQRSIEHFDAAETLYKSKDNENVGKKALAAISSALLNDNFRSYDPTPAEKILTNYYKAIAFWKANDKASARVEFNRANERARLAVERYAAEIQDAKKEADKDSTENQQELFNDMSGSLTSEIEKQFPMVSEWQVFDSFVNPAVAYTNALFLSSGGRADVGKARDLLARVRGMVGDNKTLNDDLKLIDRKSRGQKVSPNVWVVYESGLSPVYDEVKFDIPYSYNDSLTNMSFAFPVLDTRDGGFKNKFIKVNGQSVMLDKLAGMDVVLQTEYSKRLPSMIARQVVSAATKFVAQRQLADKLGGAGELIGFFGSSALAKADLRIWRSMPAEWSITKFENSTDRKIAIPVGADFEIEVDIPKGVDTLVYVKQPTVSAKPLVEVLAI